MLDHDWKAQLEQDGFVHIPHALAPEVVEKLAVLSLQSVEDFAESGDLVRTSDDVPLKPESTDGHRWTA